MKGFYSLCQHAGLVLVLLVVPELDLDLQGPELDGGLQGHGVGPVQDRLLRLLVQQVELDRVPGQEFLKFLFIKIKKIILIFNFSQKKNYLYY